jgi:hypothetical protein
LGLIVTVVGWSLLAAGLFFIVLNYGALVVNYLNRRRGIDRHHSFAPLLGGIFGASGLYFLSHGALAFVIAVADPGVWVIALLPTTLLRQHGTEEK